MRIDFYEEFPTKENLDKLKLINFKTNLHVASHSLKEFLKLKDKIKENYKNVKDVYYWPVLEKKDGYWLSAFSRKSALKKLILELKKNTKTLTVMWDAELPMLNKKLFFSQLFNFFYNRKLILKFLKNSGKHNINIITSEYPVETFFSKIILGLAAIKFSTKYNLKRIFMAYTSFIDNDIVEAFLEENILTGKKRYGKNFQLGLGVIGKGIMNERTLKPEELERDLLIAERNKIDYVVIYRLGGLSKEFVDVIEDFV